MTAKRKTYLIGGAILIILAVLIIRNRATLNAPSAGGTIVTSYSVSVVRATRQPVEEHITSVGTLAGFNDVVVLSETQGRVVRVDAEVGDFKPAGSVLVEVDSELKQAAFEAAKVSYEKAKKDLERYEALYKEKSIPEAQIEQSRWSFQSTEAQYIAARRAYTDTRITTPISGVVTARLVNVGTMVMGAPQATQIANIVELSRLKAKVSVAEKDVFRLHVGDSADVTTDVFPESVFRGRIFTISSKGDDGHTFAVEVLLNNPRNQLKAGISVNVNFKPRSGESALLIPRSALNGSVRNATVFVVKDNVARIRPVVVADEIGTNLQISSGLEEGESVVTDGENNLRDNTPVVIRDN